MFSYAVAIFGEPILISDDQLDSEGRQWLDELARNVPIDESVIAVLFDNGVTVARVVVSERQVWLYGPDSGTAANAIAKAAIWGLYGSLFRSCPPPPIIGLKSLESYDHVYWSPCISSN